MRSLAFADRGISGFVNEPNMVEFMASLRSLSSTRVVRWHPGGIVDWSHEEWATAVIGELGEAMNVVKKLNRDADGIVGNDEDRPTLIVRLGEELADLLIYFDLFVHRTGNHTLTGATVHIATNLRDEPLTRKSMYDDQLAWHFCEVMFRALSSAAPVYIAPAVVEMFLFADRYGIDLFTATCEKFNRTSEKYGFPERLSLGMNIV